MRPWSRVFPLGLRRARSRFEVLAARRALLGMGLRGGRFAARRAGPAFAGLLLSTLPSSAENLRGEDIRALVSGATVHIDTPLGTTLPMAFREDGTVTGEAGRLAFWLGARRDSGRWWIAKGRLCQRWSHWFDGEASCLTIRAAGGKYSWERDDGKSGTASIERGVVPVMTAAVEPPPLPEARSLGGPEPVPPVAPRVSVAATPAARPVAPWAMASVSPVTVPVPAPNPSRNSGSAARVQAFVTSVRRDDAVRPGKVGPPSQVAKSGRRAASGPSLISYQVANVRADDVLNIRQRPTDQSQIVATIPPDGRGIVLLGRCVGTWCPIRYRAAIGWVHQAYLSLSPMQPRRVAQSR